MRKYSLMNYRIQGLNNVCVVTLTGDICRDDRDSLLACAEEIKKSEFHSAILLFQNVSTVEVGAYRELTMLQHEIRQKRDRLHVVGLKIGLREILKEKGVVRLSELKDLKEILPK